MTGAASGVPCALRQPLASAPHDRLDKKALRLAYKGRVVLTRTDRSLKTVKELAVELQDADAKKVRGLPALFLRPGLTARASQEVAQPLAGSHSASAASPPEASVSSGGGEPADMPMASKVKDSRENAQPKHKRAPKTSPSNLHAKAVYDRKNSAARMEAQRKRRQRMAQKKKRATGEEDEKDDSPW